MVVRERSVREAFGPAESIPVPVLDDGLDVGVRTGVAGDPWAVKRVGGGTYRMVGMGSGHIAEYVRGRGPVLLPEVPADGGRTDAPDPVAVVGGWLRDVVLSDAELEADRIRRGPTLSDNMALLLPIIAMSMGQFYFSRRYLCRTVCVCCGQSGNGRRRLWRSGRTYRGRRSTQLRQGSTTQACRWRLS